MLKSSCKVKLKALNLNPALTCNVRKMLFHSNIAFITMKLRFHRNNFCVGVAGTIVKVRQQLDIQMRDSGLLT